jgi:hypothetical protein
MELGGGVSPDEASAAPRQRGHALLLFHLLALDPMLSQGDLLPLVQLVLLWPSL